MRPSWIGCFPNGTGRVGSTGTLFPYGVVVGAVALAGLSLLLVGARR